MSKYFSLGRVDAKTVKGIVLRDYNNKFKPFTIEVISQNAARIKKKRAETNVIAKGSIVDVFSHLPGNVVNYKQQFVYVDGDRYLKISPITPICGKDHYILGGLVEVEGEEPLVIDLAQYNEYLWLHKTRRSRPKETTAVGYTPQIAP